MSQLSKVSVHLDIYSPADVFYSHLKYQLGQVNKIFPEYIKGFQFLEGDDIEDGAVVWHRYDDGGNTVTVTQRLKVDDANRTITAEVVAGDIMNAYRSFNIKSQVNDGYVTITLKFEKASDDAPNADTSMISMLYKKIDASIYAN